MSSENNLKTERDLSTTGGRLGYVRDLSGLSSQKFADRIGRQKSNVNDMEHGKTKPGFDTIVRIIEQFDVPCDWLLHGRGEYPRREVAEIEMPPDVYKKIADQGEDLRALMKDVNGLKEEIASIRDDLRKLLEATAKGRPPRSGAAVKTETEKSI